MNARLLIHRALRRRDIWGAVRLGDAERTLAIASKNGVINATNDDGETVLIVALRHRHRHIAAALAAGGADVNLGTLAGWTPLMSAALHGYSEVVKLLVEHGAEVNSVTVAGQNAIQAAAVNGHDACVRLLIENGAALSATVDRLGYSPLMLAIAECSTETIRQLITLGSDVNTMSKDRMTPLRCAQQHGRNEVALMLKDAGAIV